MLIIIVQHFCKNKLLFETELFIEYTSVKNERYCIVIWPIVCKQRKKQFFMGKGIG